MWYRVSPTHWSDNYRLHAVVPSAKSWISFSSAVSNDVIVLPFHVDVSESNRWWIIASSDIKESTTRHIVDEHDHVWTIFPDVPKSSFCFGLRPRRRQFSWNVVSPPWKGLFNDRGCFTQGNGSFSNLIRQILGRCQGLHSAAPWSDEQGFGFLPTFSGMRRHQQ